MRSIQLDAFTLGDARLPYAFEEVPGAEALIVGFPKLRPGVLKPATGLRNHVLDVPAHRLYLGSDEHQYVGPRRSLRGLKAAVELVERTAARLGITAGHRVGYFGSSYGAVAGCMLGLTRGGVVVVGAPPIAMGTAVARWTESEAVGRKVGFEGFIALGDGDDDMPPAEWLDSLLPRLATEATRPVRLRFVTGRQDYAYKSTVAFVEHTRPLRLVDARIVREVGSNHSDVAKTYWRMLPELLCSELGLR